MKQKILLSMFALLLLLLAPSKQTFALGKSSSATQDSDSTNIPETAVYMTERINQYRTELNLPTYYQDQSLAQASQWAVDTMAATEFISHYDDTGANPQQRAEKAGYDEHVTEIIFGGFGGADAAWEWWIDNELHHTLITSEDYIEFGVATAINEQSGRQYWAIMFGFGDGHYDSEALTNGHNNETSVVTKLPPSVSTADITAVSPTSTATLPDPTATTEQIAVVTDNTPIDPSPTNPNTENPSTPISPSTTNALGESQWLMIAAVGTIIMGIAVFYFPRLGISQKFKERT